MEGFLGTGAPMRADLTLLAYILILAPAMIAGYVFARRKMFIPHHKYVMTGIVVVNWVLIVAVMVASYANYVAPSLGDNLGDVSIALPTLHLITGGIAQLLGTYLVAADVDREHSVRKIRTTHQEHQIAHAYHVGVMGNHGDVGHFDVCGVVCDTACFGR
jgi:hypothetical protein